MEYRNQTRCIAHEIRNQISICELYSQIIRRNIEKSELNNESVNNALNCISKSLKIMSNNLIDLKSLDNFEPKVYDICDIVKNAINLSMIYVQNKDIDINLSCIENPKVYIDENKTLACLINIIKNAIEAIEEKGKIDFEIRKIGDLASVKISNNGAMISTEAQKHIFDVEFTTKKSGNGLGLPICVENLKMENAELKLVNSTKELTEFEITIPVWDK